MNPALSNIRGTFFTNKPVEIDYEKSMKIVTALQSYQLFPFPVNGFSFQIGPNGMIPATLTSYEFRNSNNSINISIKKKNAQVGEDNAVAQKAEHLIHGNGGGKHYHRHPASVLERELGKT